MAHRPRPVSAGCLLLAAGLLLGGWFARGLRAESRLVFDPGLRPQITAAVQQSRKRIAAELYKLSDRDVIAALAQAARRGVNVQIILCPTQDSNYQTAAALSRAGADIRWYPITQEHPIMHLKLAVFDDQRLLFGSANWTHWGLTLNHEGLFFTDSQALVKPVLRRFAADWRKSSPHPPLKPPGWKGNN